MSVSMTILLTVLLMAISAYRIYRSFYRMAVAKDLQGSKYGVFGLLFLFAPHILINWLTPANAAFGETENRFLLAFFSNFITVGLGILTATIMKVLIDSQLGKEKDDHDLLDN